MFDLLSLTSFFGINFSVLKSTFVRSNWVLSLLCRFLSVVGSSLVVQKGVANGVGTFDTAQGSI